MRAFTMSSRQVVVFGHLAVLAVTLMALTSCDRLPGLGGGGRKGFTGHYVRQIESTTHEFVFEAGGKGRYAMYSPGSVVFTDPVTYKLTDTTLTVSGPKGEQVLTVDGDQLKGSFEGGVTGQTHELVYVRAQ